MNGTLEIYTNREWMILPSFVHGILPTVMYNSQNHSTLGINREKKSPMAINADGRDIFREYEVTDDGKTYPMYDGWQGIDYLKDLKQPFVNVIPIDGPITRNGGACSYGSKDIRDWMMKASDNPYCQGHLLVVNTPGGSAWAKNDFQQGID
jgi:ClpP class serine protease